MDKKKRTACMADHLRLQSAVALLREVERLVQDAGEAVPTHRAYRARQSTERALQRLEKRLLKDRRSGR